MATKKKVTEEVKDTAKTVADKATAEKIEAKKTVRSAAKNTKGKAAMTKAKKAATVAKKAPAKAKTAVKAEAAKVEKRVAAKKPVAKNAPKNEVIIQSPMGGNITPAEVLKKVGSVDQVYVRVDENKLYWVKGEETGSVEIW